MSRTDVTGKLAAAVVLALVMVACERSACDYELLETIESPDKSVQAVLYRSNCPFDPFMLRVGIRSADASHSLRQLDDKAQVFSLAYEDLSGVPPETRPEPSVAMRWASGSHLEVEYQSGFVRFMATQIGEIEISYERLPMAPDADAARQSRPR